MRLLTLTLAALLAACGAPKERDFGGQLRVRVGGREVLSGVARAEWCEGDSIFSLTSANSDWSFALSYRGAMPASASDSIPVLAAPLTAGTARAALRPLPGDTAAPAYVARSGAVWLSGGRTAEGRFALSATAESAAALAIDGEFMAVPVADGCPRP